MTPLKEPVRRQLRAHLSHLYGNTADDCVERIERIVSDAALPEPSAPAGLWNERDAVLITYGDQVRDDDGPPLRVLERFLSAYALRNLVSTVHLLPFFPYSSDDGFSVIDYTAVAPDLGDWSDVAAIGESFDLMFDLVLNHCSSRHAWFQKFLRGEGRYAEYFITPPDDADLSVVTRPRSGPLLTEVRTATGPRKV
ncbi:MAG: alpha-amylase family glycosyl hydrolase, partial [Planctomycetaceae bacterium]